MRFFKMGIVIVALVLLLSSCGIPADPQAILWGYTSKTEHFDPDGFQDYVDYCCYRYRDKAVSAFASHDLYREVAADDVEEIVGYLENFREHIIADGRAEEFTVNTDCVSEGDYVYINTKEGQPIGDAVYQKYDCYSLYFFDTDSAVLHYLHANI